jgi:hypothetical protein
VPSQQLQRRYAVVRDGHGADHRVYFAYPAAPLSAADLDALDRLKGILAEGYRLCRQQGIRLIVVFAPTEYRVYDGLPNVSEVSEEARQWVVNDLPDRLRIMARGISPEIGYVDLTPTFKSQVANGTMVFLEDDTHWSSDGHQVVAQTLHHTLSHLVASAQR